MITINPDNLSQKLVQLSATIEQLNKVDIPETTKTDLSDNIAVAFVNSITRPSESKHPKNLGYLIVHKDDHAKFLEKTIYTMFIDARARLAKAYDQYEYEIISVTEFMVHDI